MATNDVKDVAGPGKGEDGDAEASPTLLAQVILESLAAAATKSTRRRGAHKSSQGLSTAPDLAPVALNVANPMPFGLIAFGMPFIIFSLKMIGWVEGDAAQFIGAFTLIHSGVGQLLAGICELVKGNTLGLTIFSFYGFLTLGLGAFDTGVLPVGDGPIQDANFALGILVLIVSFAFFLCSLRGSLLGIATFFFVVVYWSLACAGAYNAEIYEIAGGFSCVAGCLAIYTAIALLLHEVYPDKFIPGVSQMPASLQARLTWLQPKGKREAYKPDEPGETRLTEALTEKAKTLRRVSAAESVDIQRQIQASLRRLDPDARALLEKLTPRLLEDQDLPDAHVPDRGTAGWTAPHDARIQPQPHGQVAFAEILEQE
ncbi:unnamed protein product [Vitrella brassicaformis CCMP3155]|uniref:Uncharacterized protein n=2 Tax=Vitrella brassicaformis TaxID=1169539 RepID=A0A0G4EFP5_VITBC|nr:unnamed protein product [Vitrella brassicaformis CCMP3155]|eukprot:CEL95340.1 unnamed protein product [Vitrella brassicaformis CCMP3155]